MTVYLLHFDRPYRHARHYIGFTLSEDTLEPRLDHHRNGTGARLLAVLKEQGIDFKLVRVWPSGSRIFERRLKSHSGTRYCPVCNPQAHTRMKKAS